MNKDKIMSLEEHLETADDLAIAYHQLKKVFDRCLSHYPKSHELMVQLFKNHPGNMNGSFAKAISILDGEYHAVAKDSEFDQHGYIYDNLNERYEKIK